MKTTKNDKRQIFPSKTGKFVSFFVRFVRVFTPFHQSKSGPENHGSVHVLLLGCAFCVANLQYVALAEFTANDSQRLQIVTTTLQGGYLNGRDHIGIMIQLENLDRNIRYMSNGQLLESYTPDAGQYNWMNFFTSWGDGALLSHPISYGPHYGLSMVQALNAIGMGMGTITTNGYWQPHQLTLPQLILGWDKNIYNPAVRTNGVIGRIDAMRESMESIADKTEEYQNSVTGLLQQVVGQMSVMANNQTNLMWSTILATDPPYSAPDFLSSSGMDSYNIMANSGFNNWLYFLPLYLVPFENEYDFIQDYYDQDYYSTAYSTRDDTYRMNVKNAFYKYYGNYATYDSAFNQGNSYGQYEFQGSSNIVSQTRATRPALTNDNPTTLLPIQGIPELSGDVTDFISIKNDYSNLTGPSQAEITKWSGYFENTVAESQETAGFKFGITFAGVGNEEVSIETEDVDFFESINLQRISQIGNTWIRYGVSIVKGLLMLLFVWSVAEKAVGIFVNNGMQAG